MLLQHAIDGSEGLRDAIGAARNEVRAHPLQQSQSLRIACGDSYQQMVPMHLEPVRQESGVIRAMPMQPPILRIRFIRLKMLVAFPIFSSEMRDMANALNGMNRNASATPSQHLGPEDVPESRIQIQAGELEPGDRTRHNAHCQQPPRIRRGGQVARQGSDEQRPNASRGQSET